MIEVGDQVFNPARFITRISDEKPSIILPEENHVLYLDSFDLTDLTTEEILGLWETSDEPLSLLPLDNELEALVIETPYLEAPIRMEPLTCYSPCTQTYYILPPPSKLVPPAFYNCPSHMPHQPPTTNAPTVINISPPPTLTYENNRVPYNYEDGAGESYPQLSAEEVADLVGLITRSGKITEPAITNLRQDSA